MTPFGHSALVTGTDSMGIGRAVALRLARAGLDVALHWYQDQARADEAAVAIRALGQRATLVQADLGDPAAARRAVREAYDALEGIRVVICNAGMIQRKPLLEITDEDWTRLHAVNLQGAFTVAQEAARFMIEAGQGGRIVMVSSTNQAHANPGIAHYVASKGGVMMLARAMALELAVHGITVNLVAPVSIPVECSLLICVEM